MPIEMAHQKRKPVRNYKSKFKLTVVVSMSGCEFRRKRLLMCCSSKSWVASRIGSSLVSRRIMRTPSGKVSDDVPCRKRFLGTLNGRIQLTRAGSKAMKTRQQWIFRQQAISTVESPTPSNNISFRSSALRESRHAAGGIGIGIGRSPANVRLRLIVCWR